MMLDYPDFIYHLRINGRGWLELFVSELNPQPLNGSLYNSKEVSKYGQRIQFYFLLFQSLIGPYAHKNIFICQSQQ